VDLDIQVENNQYVGGNIYDCPIPSEVIDFSDNSNIIKPPKNILKALKKCKNNIYADLSYKNAISKLAEINEVNESNIYVDGGFYQLLSNIINGLKSRSMTIVMPCEPILKDICRKNICDVYKYIIPQNHNFKFDCASFIEEVNEKSDMIYLSNPSNTTGRIISKNDIIDILDFCQPKGIYLVVDETYMDFAFDNFSCIELIKEYNNIIVIKDPTLFYNVKGLNASYAIASNDIIDLLNANALPYRIDSYSNAFLENIDTDNKFFGLYKKNMFKEKNQLLRKLDSIKGIKKIQSDCHIILLRIDDTLSATIYERLLKKNILIRDASTFDGLDSSYIRICVKDEKSNNQLIDGLVYCMV